MPQGSVPPPNPPEWLNLSPAPTPATGVWEGTPTSADAPATGDWTPGRATAPQGEAAPPRPALPGYEILGELGRGGMGVVYQARQTTLNRPVAIKMILAGDLADDHLRERFLAEAEAVAQVQHPHIVQVFECATYQGHPYLALEYLDGGTLADRLARAPQDPRWAADLLAKLADAMQAAHGRGIVHRDLKPANVLLTRAGEPKVTDFGLAKFRDREGATRSGDMVGTPAYMAPEQAAGKSRHAGPAADVYSLGAILYECLTGRPPFQGLTPMDIALQVLVMDPVPVRQLAPQVPRDLETICHKCLHKEEGRRYASAGDLAADLRRFLNGEPIRARPAGRVERAWRWCRRNPPVAGLSAAVAVLVAGAVAGLAWGLATVWGLNADLSAANADLTAANQRAVEAQRDTEAFNEFLAGRLLGAARPTGLQHGVSKDVTMHQSLDAVAPDLEKNFQGRPRAEAAARHAIGVTYRELGELARAIPQLERALALRRQHLGPEDPATLDTQNSLAVALSLAGRPGEAIPLQEHLRDVRQRRLGPDHRDTLFTLGNLAMAYHTAGRAAEALPLFEQVRDRRARVLGPDTADTLMAMHNLAGAYQHAGRRDAALALYEQTRAGRIRTLGPDHPDTLITLHGLAGAYQDAGRVAEAIGLYERVRDGRVKVLGPRHPSTLKTLSNLATAYWHADRYAQAIPLLEEVLAAQREALGADHPDTLTTLCNLGVNLGDAGRPADALARFEEALRLARARPEPPPNLPFLLASLADAYLGAGQFARAEPLLTELLPAQRQRYQATDPRLASALARLGRCRLKCGQWAAAAAALGESLAWYERHQPGHWMRANLQSYLGGAVAEQGRWAEAEPLLRQGYDGLRAQEAAIPPGSRDYVVEALTRLVRLYAAWGRTAEADQWREALIADGLARDLAWPLLWGRPLERGAGD